MALPWTIWAAFAALCASQVSANCVFRHSALQVKQPLLLSENRYQDVRRFAAVDDSGNIRLNKGDNITIACPGNYNYMSGGNAPPVSALRATCDTTYNFVADGVTIALNSVVCYNEPYHDVRIGFQTVTCGQSLALVEVGFQVSGEFLKLYDVCFDQVTLTPVSARHHVLRGLANKRSAAMSAYLFTGVNPANAYTIAAQTASVTQQLDAASAKKYITAANLFNAKLLVPQEDLIYGPSQLSLSFYFNSVPVWRPFLNGFWAVLETNIKKIASSDGDLEVYTAVSGIITLPNSDGVEKPIYLHATTTDKSIPVPEYLIKSVKNAAGKEVIFVQMVNRGDVVRAAPVQSLCAEDVCAQLRWLEWAQVPAAQRTVACCRADDPWILQRFPDLRAHYATSPSRRHTGLLVGETTPEELL